MAEQYLINSLKQSTFENEDSAITNPTAPSLGFPFGAIGGNNASSACFNGDAALNLVASTSLLSHNRNDGNLAIDSLPLSIPATSGNNNIIGLYNNFLGGYGNQEQNVLAFAALQQQRLQQQELQRMSTLLQRPTPNEAPSASDVTNVAPLQSVWNPQQATVTIDKSSDNASYETMLLQELGNSSVRRRKENSGYFDASTLADPSPVSVTYHPPRGGGVTEPFPEKLHRLLSEVEEKKQDDIIGFFSHGRAFAIHDREGFVEEIMPKYFKQSRLSSFQRQLNLYGFTRITSGPDLGGYYHELFLKGRASLAIHMRRVGAPSSTSRHIEKTPNFYHMSPVK
mmetsp:Transcript_20421/g.30305  ORF Transcript_20421/g.30305 Transcript_20421/m.30305 type:complete len:340 (-) Transcript_20421:89-1108(-)|eukprot:CAMPEP_0194207408 /NCGR_PEP_ID=MMETSP0156-20130528/6164_1 /TAXON_ID=33649 /ORGANISM="Thalassionema nitzschioides, Strain L26-B" /LENGTH=339 /DNA_ID=CAMNT_0038934169 /DNA_START=132 /DNA_END=1151 /DNA_ORIENTATION=-